MAWAPGTGLENLPYGEDPWAVIKQRYIQHWTTDAQQQGLAGVSPEQAEAMWQQRFSDPAQREEMVRGMGWEPEDVERAETYHAMQQRARGLEAGAAEQAQLAATQQRMADVLPEIQLRALMGDPTAAQWAGRAGFNELANEIAAQTAGDPRAAIRATAQGGGLLGRQIAGEQAQEGARQRAGLGGGLMAQAGTAQQQQADAVRWAAAKEEAARKWAEQSLATRGISMEGDVGIDRLRAEAEGGVDWRNLTTGLLGGASSLLSTYGAMSGRQQPQPQGNVLQRTSLVGGGGGYEWGNGGDYGTPSLTRPRPLYGS
jgi:hypothetical protein